MGETLVRAAGGAVWRNNDGTTEVAVVHRPRYDDWSLPKGKSIRGEHPLATACREVREETGVHPVLGPRLPTQRYRSPSGPKVVRFWAMSGRGGGFAPSAEVDEALWLPVPAARIVLTHQRDVTVLDALARATTVDAAVLLVRHVGADDSGRRQARALRRLLPGFGPERLMCLSDRRDRDTLAPLATKMHLPVGHGARSGAVQLVRDLAAAGGTTVIAAPGAVIRAVVTQLAHDDAVALHAGRTRKGSVWALFFHHTRPISADYYPNLANPGC